MNHKNVFVTSAVGVIFFTQVLLGDGVWGGGGEGGAVYARVAEECWERETDRQSGGHR